MPEHPVKARVMNFWTAVCTGGDRQLLPLTAQLQQPQEVIEDRMQTQFGRRTATPHHQVGQDKLLELRQAQMGRNPLPLLAFLHGDRQSERILTHPMPFAENGGRLRGTDKFAGSKNPQPVGSNTFNKGSLPDTVLAYTNSDRPQFGTYWCVQTTYEAINLQNR
jgi:hypothetical protein